ncbi:MAG: shikimate kinase [Parachlamydiales bacterium]|jgi:shikimate kinase
MNIILCGLHQSGKTTVGNALAKELGYHFIDTDHLIEEEYARTKGHKSNCRTISLKEGEDFFRQLESRCILQLNTVNQSVIALGGGSLISPDNQKIISSLGTVYYLKTPPDILWERIQVNGLPSFLDPEQPKISFLAMIEKRIPIYEQSAHFVIENNLPTVGDVVAEIIRTLHNG